MVKTSFRSTVFGPMVQLEMNKKLTGITSWNPQSNGQKVKYKKMLFTFFKDILLFSYVCALVSVATFFSKIRIWRIEIAAISINAQVWVIKLLKIDFSF